MTGTPADLARALGAPESAVEEGVRFYRAPKCLLCLDGDGMPILGPAWLLDAGVTHLGDLGGGETLVLDQPAWRCSVPLASGIEDRAAALEAAWREAEGRKP